MPNRRFPGFEGAWTIEKLGNFIDIISGLPLQAEEISEESSGIPILRGINITEGFIRHTKQIDRYYPKVKIDKLDRFLVQEGDMVIGMDGSKVGKNVALIAKQDIGSILIQRVARLRALSNADLNYIYHRIFSQEFQKYVDVVNTSSGIPHISLQQIKDFEISFPPTLTEQLKISKLLTLIDQRIATQNKIIEGLKVFKSGLSKRIFNQQLRFINYVIEENGWQLKKIGDLCDIIGGGTPETSKIHYWNGDIQWFTPTEIKMNYVSRSQRTITKLGLNNSSAKLLPKGTILLTTRATIGEVAIALEECTTNQGFQSLIAKEGVSGVFIFNWLKENKHELVKRANGSTFPEISKSAIEGITIAIPSLSEQNKIANSLSVFDEKIEMEKEIIKQYEIQKQHLLANLFI